MSLSNKYISWGMKEKFEVDRYGGEYNVLFTHGAEKGIDSDSECLILDPGNYEGEINQVEIPHERTKRRTDDLTAEEQSILRSEFRN